MQAAALPMAPIRIGDWQIIALDSHGDDKPSAAVDPDRIEALWAALDAPHVLVFTHHHMVAIDCPWLDCDRISHPLLHERLRQPSPIRAIAFGHVHQVVDDQLGPVRLLGSPSTCFQFAPGSQRFTLDDTAPGYRRIRLHADGSIVTLVGRTPPLSEPPRIGS
jgi:Icc protein